MEKYNLTMSKEFLEIMKITKTDYLFEGISFRDIREEFDSSKYRYTDGANKKSNFRSFPEQMDYIGERFGTLPKLMYWVSLILDDMDTDDGAYPYMFLNTYLMTDECQDTEFFKLDLLKKYGENLCDLISKYNSQFWKLRNHFENVKIKLDRRMTITNKDPEHKKMVELLIETLNERHDDEMNFQGAPVSTEASDFSGIVFTNPFDTEIQNMDEVREYGIELSQLFHDLDVKNLLQKEFKTLADRVLTKKDIELYICTNAGEETNPNYFYFSDFDGHPKYIANEFKKSFDRFIMSDKQRIVVETSSIYVFNIIRQYIINEKAKLFNDVFLYEDSLGKLHEFSFNENYWIDPLFAKDFLDVANIGN